MNDQITVEELEKASHNVQRLFGFIGERRDWILASDAEGAASALAEAAKSLSVVVSDLAASGDSDEVEVRFPAKLQPSGRVTAGRLIKFTDFIDQLRTWFSSHDGATLPEGSDSFVGSLQASLAGAIEAIEQLLGPSSGAGAATGAEPEPLISGDLGPVAEVDMSARLELDNIASRPLLQIFRGVTELTPEAISMIDRFFAKQGIELEGPEKRRFHDKALKWIKGTPDGQMLVVRLSGLSGKVEAYSSYKPRGT
jgi:hypothetical protein